MEQNRQLVTWYRNNAKKATLDQLMDCKTKLVTSNFYLAEHLAGLKKDYNVCYFSRKIEFSKKKNELIKGGSSATKAESLANEFNEDILRNEIENEGLAYQFELFIKHCENVANDIMQRISVLKKEYESVKQS